jgi:ParB family chromosome partitioning protein
MSKGNRFGIGPVDLPIEPSARRREPGPMSVAVRESAASAQEASDALVENRRQNAVEAREYRAAREAGRVILSLGLEQVSTEALPRDRMDLADVAASEAMEELKASIRERGQREPIEVFATASGWELKAGWRRLTALRQLREETGDPRFDQVLARVTSGGEDRAGLYLDMVEENVIRQDLSFAEMAHIAIELARDPAAGVASVEDAVGRLYRALHKVKRSYIRSFVSLLEKVELPFPRTVSRDLGVDVARRLGAASVAEVAALRTRLARVTREEEQGDVLRAFLKPVVEKADKGPDQKFEFRVGEAKVTARNGEIRIKAAMDFTGVDRSDLDRAVAAFLAALKL